jgi:uncharacterized protein (UPF0248 family)
VREPTLRELLNRLRWGAPGDTCDVRLAVVNREGSLVLERHVSFAEVRAIGPSGIVLADATFLPYHRIVAIRRNGEVLWRMRERRPDDES